MLETINATANVQINSKMFNGSVQLELNAKKIDSMLFDVYAFGAFNVASVLLTNDSILIYNLINDRLFQLSKSSLLAQANLDFDIRYDDIFSIFTGYFDLSETYLFDNLSENVEKIIFKKDFNGLNLAYEFVFNNESINNIKVTLKKDLNQIEVTYSNFKEVEDFLFPFQIEAINVREGIKIKLNYKSISINSDDFYINKEIFQELKSQIN